VLFLKDHSTRKELHKSVLKFIKSIIFFLELENLKGEIAEVVIKGIFSLQEDMRTHNKHQMLLRRVLGKMIKKLGMPYMK